MSAAESLPARTERSAGQFATTHWSVVLAAGENGSPQSSEALEKLCRTYWYPLYAYIRQRTRSPHDAEDLTQEFFFRAATSCAERKPASEQFGTAITSPRALPSARLVARATHFHFGVRVERNL